MPEENKVKEEKKVEAAAEEQAKPVEQKPASVGNGTGLLIGAIVLWVCAIAFEVLALLTAISKMFPDMGSTPRIIVTIVFIALDLICLIIGSQLWKKFTRIHPASEKNKLKCWLGNNLGVIVTAFAFIPFIILVLTNKNADKRTKAFATVAAVIALLIGGLSSYNWNPISQEQLQAAVDNIKGEVYANPKSDVYHIDDCNYIRVGNRLDGEIKDTVIKFANVETAIKDGGCIRLCKACANRHDLNDSGILIEGQDNKKTDEAKTDGDLAELPDDTAN